MSSVSIKSQKTKSLILFSLFLSPIILSMDVVQKQSSLLSFLESVPDTTARIVVHCDTINLLKPSRYPFAKDFNFGNIGHLDLTVNGPFTLHYALKVPRISLHVNGPLILGKSNDEMGIIAATHGPLTIRAHTIDGGYGKFYGKEQTLLESTLGDITIGSPIRGIDLDIKRQFVELNCPWAFNIARLARQLRAGLPEQSGEEIVAQQTVGFDCTVNQRNGAYAASDNILTLKSAANIFITYGGLYSTFKNHLIAHHEIKNLSGKISSHGTTVIEAESYSHTREGAIEKPRSHGDHAQYPGSGPAILESLQKIVFVVKNKIHNLAGSIRSGQDMVINGLPLQGNPSYTEEVQNFYTHGNYNVNGNPNAWAHQYFLTLTQSCTTQAGNTIQMNLGDFKITGNMNAAGKLAITGNTGVFSNTSLSRNTITPNSPRIVNITKYLQKEAQKPGILRLGDDNRVHTEFSVGGFLHPHPHGVLLENESPAPLNWPSLFNPLNSINLDLYVQQLLSSVAGRVSAGNAKGNNLSSVLWANANEWKNKHHKEIMSQEDLQQVDKSMLLTQILNRGTTQEQHTLLCVAPQDINPYQSQGDIVADEFSCITQNDQTHQNTREIATGPQGITLQSQAGAINLETQSYTVYHETSDSKTIQQCAMPQQQLIAPAGPIAIKSDKNITRTGTLVAAAGDVTELSDHGSIIKNPLILQTIVETHRKERKGWFSSSHTTHTSTTHQAISCETHSGATLHDKAAINIHAIASNDVANAAIIYEAPHTNIAGLLIANRTTHSTQTSSAFSDNQTKSSKETPYAVPVIIQSPIVRFKGKDAQVNATIISKELHDETEKGVHFVAKVTQMLCSEQTLIESPLFSADIGYEAGYETMIQPMLLVEKIIRSNQNGSMLFESAIINKDRTEIIGNFVETTYHLKNWQRNWHNVSQVISDEALVVIALAVALATEGMGTELLASMLNNITAATGMQLSAAGIAAFNAGFSAVCSTATASALKTGDLINTFEQMTSAQYLKSLACTAASAGLCAQLGSMLDIDIKHGAKSLPAHLQEQALRTTVDTFLNISINNASIDDILGVSLKHITIKSVAAYLSNQLSTMYLDVISNTAAQTVIGGATGFAMDPTRKGFVSGATGALTAEIVGNIIIADSHAIIDAALTNLNKGNLPLTEANIKRAIAQEMHQKIKWAKVAAAGVAAITKQNTNIAIATATNAVDNDVALRGTFYAMAEFQELVAATSKAMVPLYLHKEEVHKKMPLKKEGSKKAVRINHKVTARKIINNNDKAYDLTLANIQKSTHPNTYRDLVLQYSQEKTTTQSSAKKTLYDRIVYPEKSPFIKKTSTIIRVAFTDAVAKTVHLFSFVPNPLGMACFAGEAGWEIHQNKTTLTDVAFSLAAGYGLFKGAQGIGKGIKILYQKGSGTIKNITDNVLHKIHHYRYAQQGRVPFVENPRTGQWTEAIIAEDDLVLTNTSAYELARMQWGRDQKAPFNVVGHGNPYTVAVDAQAVHPKGLSQYNLLKLIATGKAELNAIQLARLIRTAPGYQKGQHINLFSCECGADPQGIAQQLANRMNIPVSAFSENVILRGSGMHFYTQSKNGEYGIMKTFYPQNNNLPFHMIALASLPAFVLSGDQNIPEEGETFDEIYDSVFDIE